MENGLKKHIPFIQNLSWYRGVCLLKNNAFSYLYLMKATNYQKQQLRMHKLKISPDISFDDAKKMIKNKEREIESRKSWIKGNNLESSGFFDRWIENDKPKKKLKKIK